MTEVQPPLLFPSLSSLPCPTITLDDLAESARRKSVERDARRVDRLLHRVLHRLKLRIGLRRVSGRQVVLGRGERELRLLLDRRSGRHAVELDASIALSGSYLT